MQRKSNLPVSNPSDVMVQGMKLPKQRIVHSVKDALVARARAEHPHAGEGDLLCGNELFWLQTPEDAPDELTHWGPEAYAP